MRLLLYPINHFILKGKKRKNFYFLSITYLKNNTKVTNDQSLCDHCFLTFEKLTYLSISTNVVPTIFDGFKSPIVILC